MLRGYQATDLLHDLNLHRAEINLRESSLGWGPVLIELAIFHSNRQPEDNSHLEQGPKELRSIAQFVRGSDEQSVLSMATTLAIMVDELPPPFISSAPGLANLRDIGGLPIADESGGSQSTVRKGLIYRGPDPSPVTESGLAVLKDLGITTSFDLRSKQQIDRAGGYRELEGIRRIWRPIFGEEEYTPEKAAIRYQQYSSMDVKDTVDAFTDILTSGAKVFREILLYIASLAPPSISNQPPSAFLMHCTTGNNRTGVFVGVLLSLLGVPAESIAAEYALSEIGLAPSRPAAVGRLMKSPVFAGEGGRARCERMLGARPESMLEMLKMVGRRWGGAEGYVTECCGLSDREIGSVRKVLTTK